MKKKTDFFNRYEITVSMAPNKGFGWCGKKKRFYTSYNVGGTVERIFNDAANEEEAKAERDRLFTQLLLNGARRIGEKPIVDKIEVEEEDPMRGIHPVTVTVKRTYYRVYKNRKFYGRFRTLPAAKAKRDELEIELSIKPCVFCNQRPVFTKVDTKRWRLDHDCKDNPQEFRRAQQKDFTYDQIKTVWNTKLWNGRHRLDRKTLKLVAIKRTETP